MKIGENIRQRKDGRYEARYIKGHLNGKTIWGYCYGSSYDEASNKRDIAIGALLPIRENNLLILGAGYHGKEVKKIAEMLRVFNKIDFLDDDLNKDGVLGKVEKLNKYKNEYPVAIPAVNNNDIRMKWMAMLIKEGFIIPTLIHPNATVLNSVIGLGTVIRSGATVGLNAKIGKGCIIDTGAIVNKNAIVPDYTCVECGTTYK